MGMDKLKNNRLSSEISSHIYDQLISKDVKKIQWKIIFLINGPKISRQQDAKQKIFWFVCLLKQDLSV